jgi:hypothetical protein
MFIPCDDEGKIKPTGERMNQPFFDCEKSTEKRLCSFERKRNVFVGPTPLTG